MDGIQVVPAFMNAIRAVWEHPVLAEELEPLGGPAALEEGLQELRAGSFQVLADLLEARRQSVPLAEAVFDPANFPHLTRLHGGIYDLMTARVPALWAPLIKKILYLSLPEEEISFRRVVAHVAFRGMNVAECAFAQLMLFEVLCIHQRLALVRRKEVLESIGGRRRDIENLAQTEIEISATIDSYKDTLLETEDPIECLVKIVTTSLSNHIDLLSQELRTLRQLPMDLNEINTVRGFMSNLEPDEALLFRNKAAVIFGEQKMTPEQLQVLHPVHLGSHSPANLYQKTHRATEKVKAMRDGIAVDYIASDDQMTSILDVILEVEGE